MLYSVLLFVNGLCAWIFRGFAIHNLDLHLVVAAPIAPFVFFLGVPRDEVWRISYIVSGKFLISSDFGFAQLATTMAGPNPFSTRGFNVISVALANTASLSDYISASHVQVDINLFYSFTWNPDGSHGCPGPFFT